MPMRKTLLHAVIAFAFYSCNTANRDHEEGSLTKFRQIDSLIKRDEYFAARDAFLDTRQELSDFHQLMAGAVIDNVFNRLESSNEKIDSLYSMHAGRLSEKHRYELLQLKQMNHSKLFEYERADSTLQQMLSGLRHVMDSAEIDDYNNSKKIWAALSGQPKQVVSINGHTVLDLKRDALGLQNLTLSVEGDSLDVIFDTGANLSTVTETTAKRLHIRMMDTTVIDVGSITGRQVKARLGLCPEFRLGGITVHNAVFLVFPDEALAIPQANFQINGILGFPVIAAMKEVQLTKTGQFIVPVNRSTHTEQNMALKFLNPVIYLDGENFTFDSGANSTILYDNYYRKHKKDIEAKYRETDISLGGAGGHITQKGYLVDFETTINNKRIVLDSVQLLREKLKDGNYFAGNIGQDLIGQFDKMTINFESMFIRFD